MELEPDSCLAPTLPAAPCRIVLLGKLRLRKKKSLAPGCTGSSKPSKSPHLLQPRFPHVGGSGTALRQAATFPASGWDSEFSPGVGYQFLHVNVKY